MTRVAARLGSRALRIRLFRWVARIQCVPCEGEIMVYNKLVRDEIPEMIEKQGETPHIRILEDAEYLRCLEKKLDEEVGEYHRDKTAEELADILEVAFALAAAQGCSREELLEICQKKRDARGGFEKRIFLISKE